MQIDNVFWLGGSPCSGKSTVAELMEQRLGLKYYKLDDHLDRFICCAADAGGQCSSRALSMTPDQIWMREPAVQCQEEIGIYWEIFPFAARELEELCHDGPVIAEGAGWLPELVHGYGVKPERYFCLVPSKEFQIEKYSQRPWIGHVLEGCSDKDMAFANWMERDALFAVAAVNNARAMGYSAMVNDGSVGIEELYRQIIGHFGLE